LIIGKIDKRQVIRCYGKRELFKRQSNILAESFIKLDTCNTFKRFNILDRMLNMPSPILPIFEKRVFKTNFFSNFSLNF
jgi:hypothetical protein